MITTLIVAAVVVGLYVVAFFNQRTALNTPFSIPVEWALSVSGNRPLLAYLVAVVVAAAGLVVAAAWFERITS